MDNLNVQKDRHQNIFVFVTEIKHEENMVFF